MNNKEHYIQQHFFEAFKDMPLAIVKIHQTANGWLGILSCKVTGKMYSFPLQEMKPLEIKVPAEVEVQPQNKNRITEYL